MTFTADQIIDRRRLKRRLLLWKIIAVVAVFAVVAVGFSKFSKLTEGDYIARMDVTGILTEDRYRNELLIDLANDQQVKALIVAINSPGGTIVGGEDLFRGLRRVAKNKPVVAVMGSMATSAAYMTAIGADRIIARPGTLTGSIGVILQTANVNGLMEKLGVKPEIIKSGPLKAQPNPMETFDAEAKAMIKDVIRDYYGMFRDLVKNRRGLSEKAILPLADGRVFTGRQALNNGLIDALGDELDAREWLFSDKKLNKDLPVLTTEPDYPEQPWQELVSGAIGKAFNSNRFTLDGVGSVWQPATWLR